MQDHTPDEGKSLKVVWTEGGPSFDEPVLDPLLVGTIGAPVGDGVSQELRAMTVTLDIDSIPRLREAFERTMSGEALDVVSQWHTSISPDPAESPLAFLYLQFPALDLRFRIRFVVDELRKSLAAAARTGEVWLLEPELNRALRIERPDQALRQHLSLGLSVSSVEPLRSVLRQRFDIPFTEPPGQPQRVVEPESAVTELDRFVAGSSLPRAVGIHVPPDDFTTFVVIDPSAAGAMAEAGLVENRWGHWASMLAGPHALARLDVLVGDLRLASWLFAEPSPEIVRAASAGPHRIVVVTNDTDMDDLSSEALRSGIEFRVENPPDSMRNLLKWALDQEVNEGNAPR
jgi:hypothetical protein